jgi:phosphoglycolate phosphatase
LNLLKPEAILFDWDNTLVDSWTIIFDALNFTLESFGKEPWSITQTKTRVRKSLRDSFPDIFGERWKQAAEIFYERFDDIHISRLTPIKGAQKMLKEIHEQKIFLGVVSNKRGDYLRKEVHHLGWGKYFSSLVGATDAEKDKPSPEPVALALSDCAHKSGGHIWFVGDANIDMECAHNADLTPILLRKPAPNHEEFTDYPPAFHILDCQALSNLVKKM